MPDECSVEKEASMPTVKEVSRDAIGHSQTGEVVRCNPISVSWKREEGVYDEDGSDAVEKRVPKMQIQSLVVSHTQHADRHKLSIHQQLPHQNEGLSEFLRGTDQIVDWLGQCMREVDKTSTLRRGEQKSVNAEGRDEDCKHYFFSLLRLVPIIT